MRLLLSAILIAALGGDPAPPPPPGSSDGPPPIELCAAAAQVSFDDVDLAGSPGLTALYQAKLRQKGWVAVYLLGKPDAASMTRYQQLFVKVAQDAVALKNARAACEKFDARDYLPKLPADNPKGDPGACFPKTPLSPIQGKTRDDVCRSIMGPAMDEMRWMSHLQSGESNCLYPGGAWLYAAHNALNYYSLGAGLSCPENPGAT